MTIDRAEFARKAIDFLTRAGEQRSIAYDEARFRLVVGNGTEPTSFAFLGHAYKEATEQGPSELEQLRVIQRRLWSTTQTAALDGKPTLSRVVPRLKDRAWFSAMRRQAELELGADEEAIAEVILPSRALNPELSVHLAYELPTSVMEIGSDRLESWSLSFDELLELATKNLKSRSQAGFELSAPGLFVSSIADGLDATRMLLVDDLLKLPLRGAPVAIAPSHDLLFITGDDDQVNLKQIAELAEESQANARNYISFCFRLDLATRHWQPFLPSKTTPAWPKLKLMQLQSFASACARQKEVLDALMESSGHTIQVANVRAFRVASGDMFTACAWTEGVAALLPKTDRLDLVRIPANKDAKKAKVWSTSFDAALALLGDTMVPTGDVPERYKVTAFPTDEQLEQLAKAHPLK